MNKFEKKAYEIELLTRCVRVLQDEAEGFKYDWVRDENNNWQKVDCELTPERAEKVVIVNNLINKLESLV